MIKVLMLSLLIQISPLSYSSEDIIDFQEISEQLANTALKDLRHLTQEEANQLIKMAHIQREVTILTNQIQNLLKSDFLTQYERVSIINQLKSGLHDLENNESKNQLPNDFTNRPSIK